MLVVNHNTIATCAMKSTCFRRARVSTCLAIGLSTHGSILICSPKNSSRLLDTFFRNPCILVPDTETQTSVNGVAQWYIREGGKRLLAFTRVRLGFHSPHRRAKVSGTCTFWKLPRLLQITLRVETDSEEGNLCGLPAVGRNGTNLGNKYMDLRTFQFKTKVGQIGPFHFRGSTFLEECSLARARLTHVFAAANVFSWHLKKKVW